MKKYLFLLFLFGFYLGLCLYKENVVSNVVSYKDIKINETNEFNIQFKNKINSYELNKMFSDFNFNYYITSLYINEDNTDIKCSDFNNCVKDVFSINDNYFYHKYIASGFNIDGFSIIAVSNDLISFLELNNLNYTIS